MTFEDLVRWLGRYPLWAVGFLCIPAVLSAPLRILHGAKGGGRAPWRYAYAVAVYWTCVPGLFAAMLVAYLLFFQNADLMKVNVIVFFLPIVAMAATLPLIKANVNSFDEIPGFGRLSGLMVMLGVSFAVAFALHRMHFGILFFGDFGSLIAIALVAFGLLKWGMARLSGDAGKDPGNDVAK